MNKYLVTFSYCGSALFYSEEFDGYTAGDAREACLNSDDRRVVLSVKAL